jgi:predicted MarR family transcription regulator
MEKYQFRSGALGVAGRDASARPRAETGSGSVKELRTRSVGAMHAFQRWIVSAMREAGLKNLSVIEALILDQMRHRARNKRLADICFVLNIEDARVVSYSLRKLVARGIVCVERHRKEYFYSVSAACGQHLLHFEQIHERSVLDALAMLQFHQSALPELAQYLRKMSGLYDQAARAASSF